MADHKPEISVLPNANANADQATIVDRDFDLSEKRPDEAQLVSAYAHLTTHETIRKFWRLYLVGFAVSVSGVYLGYTLTLPGSIVANQGFVNQFGTVRDATGALALDAQYVGAWNGSNFGSQVLFQLLSPFTANLLGLRFNMYCFTSLIVLAIILEIVAKQWYVYLIAKIVAGFAAGFIGTSVMTYISEITMPKMRGSHLSAFALFFAIGQVASAVGLEVLQNTNPLDYRRAFYSEFAILGIWLPILVLLPESPIWLYKKGKHDKAKRSLRKLIGNVDGYNWEHEYAVMSQEVEHSLAETAKSAKLGWVACFKGTNLRRTLISTIPFSMQNFVGGPLMFNGAYFFSLVGLSNAFTANLIILCVLMGGVLTSFYLVDRVGRRPLLLVGGTLMALFNFAVGGIGLHKITSSLGGLMVACCALWTAAYSISVAPIGWLAIVELSTPMLRAQTAGIAAVLQSLNGVIFNYTVPLMLSDQYAGWGAKIGFFFGPLAVLFTILVWFTVPETKGRTYGELDELFERRVPAWKFKSTKTSVQEVTQLEAGFQP